MSNNKDGLGWVLKIIVWAIFSLILEIVLFAILDSGVFGDSFFVGFVMTVLMGTVLILSLIGMTNIKKNHDRMVYEQYVREKEAEQRRKENKKNVPETGAATYKKFTDERSGSLKKVNDTLGRTYKAVEYGEYASFRALCEAFAAYAASYGVELDERTASRIFSAMAAARAVWLRSDSPVYAKAVALVLKKFFGGGNRILKISSDVRTPKSLVCIQENGAHSETILAEELYAARFLKDSITVLAFEDAETCAFDSAFEKFIEYFRAPMSKNSLQMDYYGSLRGYRYIDEKMMDISSTTWCVFVTADEKKPLPKGCEAYSVEIYLKGKEKMEGVRGQTAKPIAYSRFRELSDEALVAHALPLDAWKKLDRLEEFLQEKVAFAIGNPIARQLEKYVAVYMASGATQMETVDSVLAVKLLPMLRGNKKETFSGDGVTLAEFIDRLFGMENLPETHKAMTDLQLD